MTVVIALGAITLGAIALGGCYRRFPLSNRIDQDAGPVRVDAYFPPADAGIPPARPDAGFVEPTGACAEAAPIDLLLVLDDSASMEEEQALLVGALPGLVRELVEPPDDDLDGHPDWLPVPSLHVGIITTNLGAAGYPVPTCEGGIAGPSHGDDGLLRTRSTRAGCEVAYPPVLSFGAGDDVDAFVQDLGCIASVGTDGCGYEQPLEAMLRALSPRAPTSYTGPGYEPPTFWDGSYGHGDVANAGLVRDDSLLAVIVVTDEEDCSVQDTGLFDPASTAYTADLNLRCFSYPAAQHPIERYVAGLTALRADRPDLLALAVIAGVPPDATVPLPTPADYAGLLLHPAMEERIDTTSMSLVPACTAAGVGIASPARRLVRTAMSLGEGRSTVQSICQADFSPALAPVTRLFARRACQARLLL